MTLLPAGVKVLCVPKIRFCNIDGEGHQGRPAAGGVFRCPNSKWHQPAQNSRRPTEPGLALTPQQRAAMPVFKPQSLWPIAAGLT
jgi:hypothetical protein